MEFVLLAVQFLMDHSQSLAIVALAAGGLFAALKQQAYKTFLLLALKLVREVAVQELSGPEKRKAVVEGVYKALPVWAKNIVSERKAHELAEKAYQLLKGELKQEAAAKVEDTVEKAVEEAKVESVDPTKPVVAGDLHLKSPYIIESTQTD